MTFSGDGWSKHTPNPPTYFHRVRNPPTSQDVPGGLRLWLGVAMAYRNHGDRGKIGQLKPQAVRVVRAGFPPIFKQKIRDKAYDVGDSCTLRVHVVGNPMPLLSWYRNEELLSEGGRVRIVRADDGRHSLTVLQTKPNDFGVYKCVARNKYGTVTCRARMLCGGKQRGTCDSATDAVEC